MILDRLTISNFGLYRGQQAFELAPTTIRGRRAPITLVGGINGGGKTTILDAIQLVLYGNRARCSKRGEKPYEQFLKESIHHGTARRDGAGITLSFRYVSEAKEHLYEVSRSWTDVGGKVRERVRVNKDGCFDGWVSDNWSQLVEELIPNGIAQLCFFDAEKIRFLAEDETSTQAIGVAIKSLLGLDLAERLVNDSVVLEGRIVKRARKSPELVRLAELEAAFHDKQQEVDRILQELASLENPRQVAQNRLKAIEDDFARLGGEHWESRTALKRRHAELERKRSEIEQQLIDVAASELPLALVTHLLDAAASQCERELDQREQAAIVKLLEVRDRGLMQLLKRRKASSALLTHVDSFLKADLADRKSSEKTQERLHLSEAGERSLNHLRLDGLVMSASAAQGLLEQLNVVSANSEQVQRSIEATPQEDVVRDIVTALKSATAELAVLDQQVTKGNKLLDTCRSERDQVQKQVTEIRRSIVDETIRQEEEVRMLDLVSRTQQTMKRFLRVATSRKIMRLSDFITESFRFLLRKKSLVDKVRIDPDTFAITLCDSEGTLISKDRLSEGEKQIFAVSVLWGLSRASARPLPTIIDTPMARLDSKHRTQIVERYFPNASHQVIVLSTDTEVEQTYFQHLKPYIARAYHLRYDEAKKCTRAEEGYFWADVESPKAIGSHA